MADVVLSVQEVWPVSGAVLLGDGSLSDGSDATGFQLIGDGDPYVSEAFGRLDTYPGGVGNTVMRVRGSRGESNNTSTILVVEISGFGLATPRFFSLPVGSIEWVEVNLYTFYSIPLNVFHEPMNVRFFGSIGTPGVAQWTVTGFEVVVTPLEGAIASGDISTRRVFTQ